MIAHVALPLPVHKVFSYSVPDRLVRFAKPCLRVKVPFGHRAAVGFIVGLDDGSESGLKALDELIDYIPLIDDTCLRLCTWASRYYVAPLGLALKYALSSTLKIDRYCLVETQDAHLSSLNGLTLKKASAAAPKDLLFECNERSTVTLRDIFTGRPVGPYASKTRVEVVPPMVYRAGAEDRKDYYLSIIAERLEQDENVLMLLPDRHIVGEFFYRALLERFPGSVLWYHSAMSEKKRAETYFRARAETGRVILGNKSAVFLPLMGNSLIIVERPEEDEFRNEEGFKFNAVQVAITRAALEGTRIVLGSVAPPVDLIKTAQDGRVTVVEGRAGSTPVMLQGKEERAIRFQGRLPEALVEIVREATAGGQGVVLHTPRKGYAGGLYCAACGEAFECPRCASKGLNYSKAQDAVTCNSCRHVFPYEETCAHCGSSLIKFFDPGAEYVAEQLEALLPGVAVLAVTGDEGRRSGCQKALRLAAKEASVIVGTHVLSKCYGLACELLVLLGWEDFLKGGGFRAREKAFHLLANLVDALSPAKVLISQYGRERFDPSLFVDRTAFYKDELQKREIAEFPPFTRIFLLNIEKRSRPAGQRVIETIEELATAEKVDHEMMGPIEVKGRYGWRMVLKGDEEGLEGLLRAVARLPGVHIDPDPLYF